MQVLIQLLVRKLAAKPCVPPEKKWHQADQPCGEKEEKFLGAGHAGLSALCLSLRRGAWIGRQGSHSFDITPRRRRRAPAPAPDSGRPHTALAAASGAGSRLRSIPL